MDIREWTEVVGAFGLFALVTTVLTTVIWQFAATRRARVQVVRELEYRKLAESAAVAQQGTEERLKEISERLAEMQGRMDSLERILQTVE
jgi:Flp pilus assembly protein TadB